MHWVKESSVFLSSSGCCSGRRRLGAWWKMSSSGLVASFLSPCSCALRESRVRISLRRCSALLSVHRHRIFTRCRQQSSTSSPTMDSPYIKRSSTASTIVLLPSTSRDMPLCSGVGVAVPTATLRKRDSVSGIRCYCLLRTSSKCGVPEWRMLRHTASSDIVSRKQAMNANLRRKWLIHKKRGEPRTRGPADTGNVGGLVLEKGGTSSKSSRSLADADAARVAPATSSNKQNVG